MSLYQLDDNDISGTVSEWQKRREEEEKKQRGKTEKQREKEEKERLKREEREAKEKKKKEKVTRENEEKERAARERGGRQKAAKGKERIEHEKAQKHIHSGTKTSRSASSPTSDKRADNVPLRGKHRDSTRRESESGAHSTGNDKTRKAEKEDPDPRFRRHRTEEKAGTTKIDTAPQPYTSALKPEELQDRRPVKPQSDAYTKKTSTPRSSSTSASLPKNAETPSTHQKKSSSSDWGTWEVVSEDIEKMTRNKYELMQEYEHLGIANFRLEEHNNSDVRMLAFGPDKKTFEGQRGKLILYTSKKGNGLFLIDKIDSNQRPVMPLIEPKVDCKTSVVFNKDRYDVEEARLDSQKLNNGVFPLACIEERHGVPL
ncbi:hypothetical protein ACEPAH_8652 [Sanghuangporus vaninii]